ncbi:2-oxoacid:acceptor oxidoreductase subunit alpha [Pseudothermotoga thermarum]|uniref:Pyruvate flavodoxin/ferredoxin oxidoreductase domain protein n=1 Tax=Pseudothermotoga thermarum DSM 5069 TaxID=688269 RepID=F7YUN9_9THEM|nr:2-oxoacid:acceptor oxidoreductase subunit alpha [Pseudothermotoga thermarum]AEH50224.1 pyruvate flavodoxin/ferredoxin oxidoreductase domain protein [Pseudothermotoga thermarum DSM 5069]
MEYSFAIFGEAGQGIQFVESLVPIIAKKAGFHVFSYKEYMSRIRGGSNSTLIRISDENVKAFKSSVDFVFILSDPKKHISRLRDLYKNFKSIFVDETFLSMLKEEKNVIGLPILACATQAGNKIFQNTVVVGTICSMLDIPKQVTEQVLRDRLVGKDEEVLSGNLKALQLGYELGKGLKTKFSLEKLQEDDIVKSSFLLAGFEGVALGALYAGCNFISSYPMSPSTPVLTALAEYSKKFDIIVEQAEDEIAAINMALGAWYAGARAMVTTSGGGFALMVEALSLAGAIESPLVVHLAQRPGPATGMPTRTEQGDLLFAIYAGHGEFPRVIYTPGDTEEAFELTYKAFDVADRYQIPVLILTDQYLIDSIYDVPDLPNFNELNNHIVKTDQDYKRYQLTDSGISLRGIPGYGDGLVCVDSDEHDEYGRITEDFEMRRKMVRKRWKKLENFSDQIPLRLYGPKDYKYLCVCFGSTKNAAIEAAKKFENLAVLHFVQIFPFPKEFVEYAKKAEKMIVVEGNFTRQLSKLIKQETGFDRFETYTKYNGLPFSVEEILDVFKNTFRG